MADLFHTTFHSLLFPSHNFPSKPSQRLRISTPIPLPRQWLRFRMHVNSISPSSSSPNSDTEDFDVLSSTVCSDGSVVFRFGNATEIREKLAELDRQKLACEDVHEEDKAGVSALLSEGVETLNTEVDHNSGEGIESYSVAVVGDADQNLQRSVNESGSVVNDTESETNVINDSQKVDRHLKLNPDEDVQHGNLNEDVAAEGNDILSVSEADSENESVVIDNDSMTSIINDSEKNGGHLKLDSVKDGQHGVLSEGVAAEGKDILSVSEADSGNDNVVIDNDSMTTIINDSQKNEGHLKLDIVKDGQHGVLSEGVAVEGNDALSVSEENFVLDNDSATIVISVSQEIDGHLKLDSVDDGQQGVVSEDVAAEGNDVPSVCEEDSEKENFVPDDVSTTNVINDSQEIDRHLELGSVKDSKQGILSEDTAADGDDVPSASPENSEMESFVIDKDSVKTVVIDSQEIDRRLKLDKVEGSQIDISSENVAAEGKDVPSVSDGEHGNLSKDVAVEDNDVPSVSEEFCEGDRQEEDVVSTVASESNMFSDLISGASGEVEDKEADKGHGKHGVTSNLTGSVDAELMSVSTSLESEQVANEEEITFPIVDDLNGASRIRSLVVLHDLVPSSDLENKIDIDNDERSDYESLSCPPAPETYSVETASQEEKSSRTELFLITGAACLPHPSKALIGREDAYFISRQNWLGVADGVGQWSLEGSNTGLYIRELMEKCENIVSNHENSSTIKPAEVLIRCAAETQSSGSSAVLVAHFDGQALHAANVGNTGFVVISDGSIFKKSTPMFHEFNFPLQIVKGEDPSEIIKGYKIDLNDGDVIIIATNGLFDNLYEQEIASIISKSVQAGLSPQEIAEILGMRAQEVGKSSLTRSPFSDAAQAVGYVGYTGGKLDDITVIVSFVQTR
ncbi:PREDICTED: probable protein phosphatase 2C 62 isoform X1 [Lupinus angustifolius]|uniref:probable protein phosphatase 2C 62 isoform X1 n=1 Tax=Lupinus angustifolius TaxID=3871 RepID=UPI00092F8370|nr:PREDICTED: probable protein phosphatase 2C 62 isoform X1 [Lupinus angustifolius]